MYSSQILLAGLYNALLGYRESDAYADLLEPWLECHSDECRWFHEFAGRGEPRANEATDEDLCHLYAASRVTSLLLLGFQTGRTDGTDYPGPLVNLASFQLFHEAIGFTVPEPAPFHPFYHSIVGVHQTAEAGVPIQVVEQKWPSLMLGDLMYCRAGCVVSGGAAHVLKDVAEHSKLYWTFRRKDRPCQDQSHGWGHNSQWRTRLRRDYRSQVGFRFNVDGTELLTPQSEPVDGLDASAMIELVRHRCLIRTVADDADFYPYLYSYFELDGGDATQ